MKLSRQSATKFLKGKLPGGAVVLLRQTDPWVFVAGNPELWRLTFSDESESGMPGWYARVIQIDYWRNDGDQWSAEGALDTLLAALGFAVNPNAVIQVPRNDYSGTTPRFRSWMQATLTAGLSWKIVPPIEPDIAIVQAILSLTIIYAKP